jgi:Tol biopolymer transport system component
MRKWFIQLGLLAMLCLTLISLTTFPTAIHAADSTKTPAAVNTGEYSVLDTMELDLRAASGGTHAHLSPNGNLIAYGDPTKFCIYTVAGEEKLCTALNTDDNRTQIDDDSVVWSPDSSKVVFSSPFMRVLRNPGIWVMDAVTGEITKVTGVGYERASLLRGEDIVFDLAPQWLPDSQHLVFLRYSQVKKERTGPFIDVLDLATGEITEYDNLISQSVSIYLTGISADGKLLAYNNEGRGSKIEGGLWLYNLDTRQFKKLTSIDHPKYTPRIMSFNADATQILVTDASELSFATPNGFDPALSPVYIVDVATGEKMLVDDTRYAGWVGWSPDGKRIAYLVYDPIQQPDISGLYIATEPGKPGKLVLPGYFIVPTDRQGQPIIWADNDTLILSERERGFKLTVVKLGVK